MMKRLLLWVLLLSCYPAIAQDDIDMWSDDAWGDDSWAEEEASPWNTSFFLDAGLGLFTQSNAVADNHSLQEIRIQHSTNRYIDQHFFSSKIEFIGDGVEDHPASISIREFYLDYNALENLSLRIGEQILTWGTGDFVFLNDFFPKDWEAMFSGRDDNYLKAPSTSIKASYYNPVVNINVVWTPDFTADNYISGERFSYFNPLANDIVADNWKIKADEPENTLSNSQYFLRLYKTLAGIEYAFYAYSGFYTQPLAYDPAAGNYYFPELDSYGASLRMPLLGGIVNMETAYWDSRQDSSGDNPFIPNSQLNLLVGYEKEAVSNLVLAGQVLLQHMIDHDDALRTSPQKNQVADENHYIYTLRVTWNTMQQKMTTSLFMFYSPDSRDYYLKPKFSYRHSDRILYVLGANIFSGKDDYTQWAQFQENTNLYARVRFTF